MDAQDFRSLQEAYMEVVENQQLDEVSDRKVRAVRDAREKQWNKQFGKNRVQDPTDDMVDKVDKLIDQRNKRTGSKVKKTTMGQLRDKLRREEVSVYDIILSHLLDEGYAETPEAAEAIMVNMSEDWREDICEGYKKFPYKKVEDKIHKKEADNPTGRGTPQSVKMDKVFRHFKGEVRRTERRENSPKISKSKESENRARGTQKG